MSTLPRAVLTRVSTGERIGLRKDATAGRLEGSEILLSEGRTSRTHARLTFAEDAVWIEDLGSSNGTFVNDVQTSGRVQLKSGDRLRFDIEAFEVSLSAEVPATGDAHPVVAVAPVADPISQAPPAPRPVAAPLPPTVAVPFVAPDMAPLSALAAEAQDVVAQGVAAPATLSAPAQDGGAQRRPGAWAHNLTGQHAVATTAKSTKFLAPSEIKQMMSIVEAAAGPTPEMDAPHLQIISGSRAAMNVPLRAGAGRVAEWSVGSDPQREVVLPDDGVSAFHARIVNEGQRWKVVDQMSVNGTFVNGKRSSVGYVSGGDRLLFGSVECVFQTKGAKAASRSDDGLEIGGGPVAGRRGRWVFWAAGGIVALALLAFALIR